MNHFIFHPSRIGKLDAAIQGQVHICQWLFLLCITLLDQPCWIVPLFSKALVQMHHSMHSICCFMQLANLSPWSFCQGLTQKDSLSCLLNSYLGPRSASELHPEKRKFLRVNAGAVGEILGSISLSPKEQDLRIILNSGFALTSSLENVIACLSMMLLGICWLGWLGFMTYLTKVSAYAAGFPCTPYSMLSTTRRMLHDSNAQQLFRVVKRLRKYRPKVLWIALGLGSVCTAHGC